MLHDIVTGGMQVKNPQLSSLKKLLKKFKVLCFKANMWLREIAEDTDRFCCIFYNIITVKLDIKIVCKMGTTNFNGYSQINHLRTRYRQDKENFLEEYWNHHYDGDQNACMEIDFLQLCNSYCRINYWLKWTIVFPRAFRNLRVLKGSTGKNND